MYFMLTDLQDMTDWMVKWVEENPQYTERDAVLRIIATFFAGIHTITQVSGINRIRLQSCLVSNEQVASCPLSI
jgi:hypothetical protein